MLNNNFTLDEICNETKLTKRKIKMIRYIINNATKNEIDIMLSCRYLLTSIQDITKMRKTLEKRGINEN